MAHYWLFAGSLLAHCSLSTGGSFSYHFWSTSWFIFVVIIYMFVHFQCYSTSDNIDPIPSPVSCWYNPNDKQQAIEQKRFQLYEAVHSLFWPLLVCVLSIAFIIPYFVLLAQGRLSCQCKCSPRTVCLLTAFRTCAVSAQMWCYLVRICFVPSFTRLWYFL